MYAVGSSISGCDHDPPDQPDVVTSSWEEDAIDLPSVTADDERTRAVWVSPQGVVRAEEDEQRRVDVEVAMVVTDRRILFVARGGDSPPSGTYSLAYSDLAGVDAVSTELSLTTTGGVVWRIPLPEDRSSAFHTVIRHIDWLGGLRNRARSCETSVELATGEIREHAHALDWQRARRSYEEVREQLDRLICDVQLVEPVAFEELAPELTALERQLERAHTRLYIERAKAALAMGRHLIENEEYDRAGGQLREAQEFYDSARDLSDAVRRSDAFQFGPQRELQDNLENLGWEIETVAAEPIRQAHEAKIEAQFLDDPSAALDHWETAFRGYGHVLTLEWDDDGRNFAGDSGEVRRDRRVAAERIVALREQLAKREWNAGADRQAAGDDAHALDHCAKAVDHLERVHELATEFDVGDPSAIEGRIGRMRSVVDQLNEHVAGGDASEELQVDGETATSAGFVRRYEDAEPPDALPQETDEQPESTGANPSTGEDERTGDSGEPGTRGGTGDQSEPVEGLSNLDVHHEITLETSRGSPSRRGDDDTGPATAPDDGAAEAERPDDDEAASEDVRPGTE